jgi:hypothetical protein
MRQPTLILSLALWGLACDRVRPVPQVVDAGPVCEGAQRLVNGECRLVCQRDGDCEAGNRCNLLSGRCELKAPAPDSGVVVACTEGARRCSLDTRAVERCGPDGGFAVEESCPRPDGFCQNERCLACRPGVTQCGATPTALLVCEDTGSGFRTVTCQGTATCTMGECRECTAGERRCAPDGKSVQECQRRTTLSQSTVWVNAGDNFDGTCITQQCTGAGSLSACAAPQCIPASTQCQSASIQQTCTPTGQWASTTCTTVPGLGPTAECQNGACVDECGDAVRQKSYFGCEYWTAVLDNVNTPSLFKGGTTTGQGTQDSEFAFVITNRSTLPTTVTIERSVGGAVQVARTVSVPGRLDPMTRGLAVVRVPWQSVGDAASAANGFDSASQSGLKRFGYRITSGRPVSVYQFNPLGAFRDTGTCTSASQCTQVSATQNPQCVNGTCRYFSYTNDASLLLPAHILGISYVGLTPEHIIEREGRSNPNGAARIAFNGQLTIVATAPNTQVTVRASARTRAGPGVPAIERGNQQTFTLNAYDVVQLASDNPSPLDAASNLECVFNPFVPTNCSDSAFCSLTLVGCCSQLCRVDNDLTGTIVTSNNPVAVFGGSSCTVRDYNTGACDHVEEQLFPFVTWGQNFVASRTAPLRLTPATSNQFAAPGNAGPDFYKIVAGCPASTCPAGTLLTITPPPSAGDVLSPNRCLSGSLSTNTCRLAGGGFVEFRSRTSFTISADRPVQVAQLFAGQNATGGAVRPSQGDPSLILLPPVEQWRSQYTVLTAPGIRDNYLGLVIDESRVLEVRVNGVAVPAANFTAVGTSPFRVSNVPVPVGTHTILVVPRPGQSTLPGAGVTVYGFDSYVSYGYTGGLDLTTIVTGINPGG